MALTFMFMIRVFSIKKDIHKLKMFLLKGPQHSANGSLIKSCPFILGKTKQSVIFFHKLSVRQR